MKGMKAAEFFAGIGLVRMGIERAGFEVAWANDIEPLKHRVYAANFDADDYVLGDVRQVHGDTLPTVALATASFPCIDLSLAGRRLGLEGEQSGMFWEFARVLREMGGRRPPVVMLENVPAFATSHDGKDLAAALGALNDLGYVCDLLLLDARTFVPQSRPRLFVVASQGRIASPELHHGDPLRPAVVQSFAHRYAHLDLQFQALDPPTPVPSRGFSTVVERFPASSRTWWDEGRTARFMHSLSPLNASRLATLRDASRMSWRTAYRRTRRGVAVWEIRADTIAGCLRTATGGSSKQAVVEAGRGHARVRWMTATEYARLQGAGDLDLSAVTPTQAMFGLGDAVCVPAVEWLGKNYLRPLIAGYRPSA